jgi:hypothetical protein
MSIPKMFDTLTKEQREQLATMLPVLESNPYEARPKDFGVHHAQRCSVTVSAFRATDDETLQMWVTVEFSDKERTKVVKVFAIANCKKNAVAYMLPISPSDIDDLLLRCQPGTTITVVDNDAKLDSVVEGGVNMTVSFFKALTSYTEALQNAIAMLDSSLQELQAMAEASKNEQSLEELEQLRNEAGDAFTNVYKLLVKATEMYTKVTKV